LSCFRVSYVKKLSDFMTDIRLHNSLMIKVLINGTQETLCEKHLKEPRLIKILLNEWAKECF
jgi:hypothetical protein